MPEAPLSPALRYYRVLYLHRLLKQPKLGPALLESQAVRDGLLDAVSGLESIIGHHPPEPAGDSPVAAAGPPTGAEDAPAQHAPRTGPAYMDFTDIRTLLGTAQALPPFHDLAPVRKKQEPAGSPSRSST